MTETIKLMKAHTSVRRFKEQEIPQVDLNEILTAAQMASSWKNFQSYTSRSHSPVCCFPSLCRRFEPSRKGSPTSYRHLPTPRCGRSLD